ncbi:MAG TPA: CHAT domain-containing protein [Longimicrobium sp.]|nr:CHAT domain-containing protein [Longimicrobium sp.]
MLWWDGQPASLDETIERLSDALRLEGDSVPLLVDLSAVHLFRAQETENERDLVESLNHAHDALEIEPRNQSALFNFALASEALYLDASAKAAWSAYLAVDSTSPWADEARERLRALRERLRALSAFVDSPTVSSSMQEVEAYAARHPQEAREQGWHDVLGAWGRAVLGDSTSRADSLLLLASRLGTALASRPGGDSSLADAMEAIRAVADDPAATDKLARAHAAYGYGQVNFYRYREAAPDSLSRVLDLEPPSPALVAWAHASSPLTMASLRAGGPPEAGYRTLLARIDTARYPALAARVHWMWGRGLSNLGKFADAQVHFAWAARTYQRLGEAENYGALRSMEGWMRYEQGDTLAGYRMTHQATTALRSYRRSLRLHNVMFDLARYAARDGMPSAAFVLQDEGVAVARQVSSAPSTLPEALLSRAQFYIARGDTRRADADLDSAEMRIKLLDSLNRVLLIHTRAAIGNRPAAELDSAIEFFSRNNNRPWWMAALMRRADLRLAQGDLQNAGADLDTITAQIERVSEREPDYHLRSAVIEEARSRFDQLVMLHVAAGRSHEALAALERGRVSFVTPTELRPAPGERLRGPEGQVVLEYALIGDTLLVWTIRGDSVILDRTVVDRDSLVFAIERAGQALEAERDDVAEPLLERLHGWLMGPVLERLPAGARLVIVADGEIGRVPFVALRDSGGGYLLDSYTLSFASGLADAGRRAPADRSALRALLVADPEFDRGAHPSLNALDSARAEMAALRAIYHDADTLSGGNASTAALRARASWVDVIHYAGHAVFDDTRPKRSFLVLAENDRLTADTVSRWELGGVRLVVLSACSTIRARHGRSGGFAGLSGAFLSAGAGGVVGSLWKVDDGDARRLMEAFHREYEKSRDPAAALRTAQRQMRGQRRPIAAWAGFRYVGG